MSLKFNRLKIGKFQFFSLMALCLTLGLIACGDSDSKKSEASKRLLIGTSADNPPFEFYTTGDNKQFQGFDIDLAYALAEVLGLEVEFQDMDFNSLIPALQAGRLQIVMAAMSPSLERSKNVDFTQVYFRARHALITHAGIKITHESQLQDKKIGVQLGSTFDMQLKEIAERVPGITIVSLNRLGELLQELRSNRIDAVLTEEVIAKAYVGSNLDIDANVLEGHDGEFAIAVPKGSPLLTKLNGALQELQANGKLEKIRAKWFPSQ
jgi:ABC-type amino acid transport substrate-binding protein